MPLICPNCQCTIEHVEGASIEVIRCPACGSAVRPVPDRTGPWQAGASAPNPSLGNPVALPMSRLRCLDQVCDQFEAAWQTVGTGTAAPRLEDYALRLPEPERGALVRELIVLDIDYRRRAGQDPQPADYLLCFPTLDPAWLEQELASSWVESGPGGRTPEVRPAPEEPVAIGQTITHFRIVERLGAGGMGVVYKAHDSRLGRHVALKFLSDRYAQNRLALERFQREARTASELNHPHICTLHDIGEHAGQPFLVMELLEGRTLKQRLAGQPLPTDELLELGIQIADALDAAHAKGIVHRDIKPANLFVTRREQAKVLDFGLAKLVAGRQPVGVAAQPLTEEEEGPLSSPGTVLGTVAYMSPEQARGQELDARTDLFSFGVVLYEMATGRRPFQGNTSAVIFDAILNKTPLSPLELNPGLPVELEQIINKAIEKGRELRCQTAAELRADLKRLKRDLDSGRTRAANVTVTATLPVPPRPRWPRRLAWSAACGILALLLGGVVWLQFFRTVPQATPQPTTDASSKPVLPTLRPSFLTTDSGSYYQPAFSPDGTRIAFVWDGAKGDNFDIYVRDIRTGAQVRLTEDPADDFSPVWRPPDGSHIAFARFEKDKGEGGIFLMDALTGGRPIRLCSHSLPAPWRADPLFGCSLTWSPDGKTLAFPSREAANDPPRIVRLDVETRTQQPLTVPSPGHRGDFLPTFSGDGRWLAFLRDRSYRTADIYLAPATGGEPVQFTKDNVYIAGLAWTPDSQYLVFSSNREGGLRRLWRNAVAGGNPEVLSGVGEEASDVAIAAQGHRLAYVRAFDEAHLWRMKRPATPEERPAATRFAPSRRWEAFAQYSRDSKRVTFVSDSSGSMEIWVCDSEGLTSPIKLTSFTPHMTGTPRLSHDGQDVVFDSRKSGRSAIWAVGVEDGRPPRQLTTGQEDITPSWSRDKQWVYFSSPRRENDQIWKVRFQEGQKGQEKQLTTKQGGRAPFESADGKWVYYYAHPTKTPSIWRV